VSGRNATVPNQLNANEGGRAHHPVTFASGACRPLGAGPPLRCMQGFYAPKPFRKCHGKPRQQDALSGVRRSKRHPWAGLIELRFPVRRWELIVGRQMAGPCVSAQAAINRCAATPPMKGCIGQTCSRRAVRSPTKSLPLRPFRLYLCVPSAAALLLPQSLDVTHVNPSRIQSCQFLPSCRSRTTLQWLGLLNQHGPEMRPSLSLRYVLICGV
jgi:hypothetical protein